MLVYKRGKGNVSRGIGIAALGLLAMFGCRELYHVLLDSGLTPIQVMGWELRWADLITGIVATACLVGVLLLLNNRRVVDFLLETEVELKKVSWSPRHQLFGNTVVVIVSVVVLGLFILVTDNILEKLLFRLLLGLGAKG
jgi:preprotein translocase SecE subunit